MINMDVLKNTLVQLGYERVGQVEMPGQFSVRGGIVDIYSLTEENPWRIELWGDEVDSIRSFDAESQRSLENLDEIAIYPAVEWNNGKKMVSFVDYFPGKKCFCFWMNPTVFWKTDWAWRKSMPPAAHIVKKRRKEPSGSVAL